MPNEMPKTIYSEELPKTPSLKTISDGPKNMLRIKHVRISQHRRVTQLIASDNRRIHLYGRLFTT